MVALTPNYSYNLPTVGEDLDSWGALLNANWTKADTKFKALSDADAAITASALTAAQVIALIYPIGSIYISIKPANPSTFLTGTTWVAKAQGRAIIGVGTADGTAWAVNEVKGSSNVTLTAAMMPSHTHTIDAPAQAFTSGTESAGHSHGVSQSGHSHGITDVAHSHTAGDSGHGHTVYDPPHTHGYADEQLNNVTGSSGSAYGGTTYRVSDTNRTTGGSATGVGIYTGYANVVVNASGTGLSGTAAANANITIGGRDTAHTHATTVDLSPFASGGAGSDGAHTNIQPSIGLYIWERTA